MQTENLSLAKIGGKYAIIGSDAQVAATESRSNLNLCRRIFRAAKFSNGCRALVCPLTARNKSEAAQLLERSNKALAFVSGRLGRWLTPTFVIVESAELNRAIEDAEDDARYQAYCLANPDYSHAESRAESGYAQ